MLRYASGCLYRIPVVKDALQTGPIALGHGRISADQTVNPRQAHAVRCPPPPRLPSAVCRAKQQAHYNQILSECTQRASREMFQAQKGRGRER